jgi:hypothetical protein
MSKKKDVYYRQCVLKNGSITTTAWIPEKFAESGRILEIKEVNGWIVQHVGSTRKDSESVKLMERLHTKHRKGCDI